MVTKSKKRQAKRAAAAAGSASAAPATRKRAAAAASGSGSAAPATRKRRKRSRRINEPPPSLNSLLPPNSQFVSEPIPLKVIFGDRSSTDRDVEALTWTCGQCKKENAPRRGLVADYPVLQCDCGQESDIEFDFSLGNVMINNRHPVIQENVKDQTQDGCTVAATSTSIEITLNMQSILAGKEVGDKDLIIEMDDLEQIYEKSLKVPGLEKLEKWDEGTIHYLASLAKLFGVKTVKPGGFFRRKLAEFVRVNLNFYDIVRVLADGHPLATGIRIGKNFGRLKPGQIYKAPRKEKIIHGQHSQSAHAIVLIGAGRRGNTNYYHFMNSWGKFFCVEEDGRFGFGMIRATDLIFKPYKFIRFKQEADFHKRLASTV